MLFMWFILWFSRIFHSSLQPCYKLQLGVNLPSSSRGIMSSTTNAALSRFQSAAVGSSVDGSDSDGSDFSDGELLSGLDDAFDSYRAQRMEQFSQKKHHIEKQMRLGYGRLIMCDSEKQVFEETQKSGRVLLHLSNKNFETCRIMESRLQEIAQKHLTTRVIQIEADRAPFLTTKLDIQVLPCVIGYVKSREVLRLIGFTQLGNSSTFKLKALETLLLGAGLVNEDDIELDIRRKEREKEEDEEDDLDI